MDPRTGEIFDIPTVKEKNLLEKKLSTKLVPLTEKQAKELKPLSKRMRKRMLKGWACPCGSKKAFKKCCWKKYQRKYKVA